MPSSKGWRNENAVFTNDVSLLVDNLQTQALNLSKDYQMQMQNICSNYQVNPQARNEIASLWQNYRDDTQHDFD